MPLYDYICLDCEKKDARLGAVDDYTARCVNCGGLMIRATADIFGPLFQPDPVYDSEFPKKGDQKW